MVIDVTLTEQHAPKDTKTAVAVAEKPQVTTEVTTFGYRLENASGKPLSAPDKLRWEAALTGAALLRARLQQNGIDTRNGTISSTTPIEDVYYQQIDPIIKQVERIFGKHADLSEEEMRQEIAALQGMVDLSNLTAINQLTLRIDGMQSSQDINTLLGIWMHDAKTPAVSARGAMQLMQRARKREADAEEKNPEQLETDLVRHRNMIARNLLGLGEMLEKDVPFKVEEAVPKGEQEAFAHEPVATEALYSAISEMMASAGLHQHLDSEEMRRRLSRVQVNWQGDWARRFIETIVDNARKSYLAIGAPPEKWSMAAHMRVMGPNLELVFRDKGKGYPEEWLANWNDPEQREVLEGGWDNLTVPTAGIGFKTHSGILEREYKGEVHIGNNHSGGAETTLVIPLISF